MRHRPPATICITKDCGRPRRGNQRTCAVCHAQKMRESRRRRREEIAALKRAASIPVLGWVS